MNVDDNLRNMMWVNVKDAIPMCRCLAYTPESVKIELAYRIIPAGLFTKIATDATCWMALPSPPN